MKTLLADIGGTHVRFALAGEDGLIAPQKLKAADFKGFEQAVDAYLDGIGDSAEKIMAATAAWPDENGVYEFSNETGWVFDPDALRARGFVLDRVYNDFEAASYGAFSIPEEERTTLRRGRENSREYNRLVCGPGTGLGLGWAVPQGDRAWRVQPTFGARMLVACYTEEQHDIAKIAQKMLPDGKILEFEHLASGRGMIHLHKAVCDIHGLPQYGDRAQNILENAQEKSAKETLRLFHEFLGLFIHSAVMMTHSYAGVYLNGGMMDRLLEKNLLQFDTIETYMQIPIVDYVRHIMRDTPVYYVSDPFLALKGLMEAHSYA